MSVVTKLFDRAVGLLPALDPEGAEQLMSLKGKRLGLNLTSPNIFLIVEQTAEGLRIRRRKAGEEERVDVTLSGNVTDFLRQVKSGPAGAIQSGRIRISGDVETGRAFQRALSRIDFDWEDLLARYFGDTPAHKIGTAVRRVGNWSRRSATRAARNVADVLTEEKRLLVSRPAMERFEKDLTALRGDVDRLQRRLENLMAAASRETGDR